MTLGERQRIFTLNIGKLILFAYEKGYELTFGEVTRPQSQVYLNYYGYDVKQSGSGIVLVKRPATSKTLQSRHVDKLAADLNVFSNDVLLSKPIDYKPLGDYWESLHPDNRWGGDWDRDDNLAEETFLDPYHFEMRPA